MDHNDPEYEIYPKVTYKNTSRESVKEDFDGAMTQAPPIDMNKDSLNVTSTYDSVSNDETVTITARNAKAKELTDILKLSGLVPSEESSEEPDEAYCDGCNRPEKECVCDGCEETSYEGKFMESFGYDHDADKNSMWCDMCGNYHDGPCPIEGEYCPECDRTPCECYDDMDEYRAIQDDMFESTEMKRIKHPGAQCTGGGKNCKKAARWRTPDGRLVCDGCKRDLDYKKDKKMNESLSPERTSSPVRGDDQQAEAVHRRRGR